jgi:hypothetical protein
MENEDSISKEPKIVFIRRSDKEDFKLLLDNKPFSDKENKYVFLISMLIGFKNGLKNEIKDRDPSGFFRTETLNDKEKSLIKTIAIADQNDLLVLKDKKKVYRIAEEYAAGGIKILKDKVFSSDYADFTKRFEKELSDIIKK